MPNLFPQLEREEPGARAGRFVRVAVERGIDAEGTGEGLTYRATAADLAVGQRVIVPLGRGNRPTAGIIVAVGGAELLGDVAPGRVKPITQAMPSRLPARLVELAQWMADYYVCPLGMVLATMLPAAVKHGVGLTTRVEVEPAKGEDAAIVLESNRLTPSARRAWEALTELADGWPAEPKALASRLGLKNLGPLNRLLDLGLLRRVERQVVRTRMPWEKLQLQAPPPPLSLTRPQREIAEGIGGALGSFSVHLIRGVTGSGKTEVYMQVIRRAIDAGRTALVLVPEIALTPQAAGRFHQRFGGAGGIAVLHSGLTASERHRQWSLAASGGSVVIVGARSAVFAPVERLGVIVVDEEHATDYKQDQAPRYHGRDVAIKRAQMEKCPVILGSATPSLESWANARAGRYRLWELADRVGGGRLPRVEIVDLAAERRQFGGQRRGFQAVGHRMEAALRATLAEGGQAILLLNRRGHSSYISCPNAACGWCMGCEYCDASMVLHRVSGPVGGEVVRCHHCLAEQMVPRQCPLCAKRLIALGVGTQRLEEELLEKLGTEAGLASGSTMVRVDGDTMRTARDYFRVLARFGAGEVKLLLGTQMIAKGLDFPNVRLVGVINADTGLALPDFRASERTFQLVSQVAGRAGRGEHPGLVIVQTVNPRERAIERAAMHDYVGFAEAELAIRTRAGLPPATRMARIVVRDESHERAGAHAAEIAAVVRRAAPRLRLLGPGPCPIARIAGLFRYGLELIAPTARDLHTALAAARKTGKLRSDATTAVDVDPVALM
ncbi:MAG: primosomal protein N' [Phycisphaerales bacterium]